MSAFIAPRAIGCAALALATLATAAEPQPAALATAAAAPLVAAGEAGRTRAVLDGIPGRAGLLERVTAITQSSPALRALSFEAGRLFFLRTTPGGDTAVLAMREGLTGAEKVLVDPLARADGGRDATIAGYSAAPDGHHVAFAIARGPGAVLHVLDVDRKHDLPFEIDRVAWVDRIAWQPDGKAFYYARIPEGDADAVHARIYRHVLGRDTDRDEVVFAPGVGGARDIPEMAESWLMVPRESRYAYALVRALRGGPLTVQVTLLKDLAAGRPRWHEIAGPDAAVMAIDAWRNDLYLLTADVPNRRVLRVAAGAASLAGARVAVAEGDAVIRDFGLARDALYLRTMVAGVDRLERVRNGLLGAGTREFLRLPYDMAISELIADPRRNGALLRLEGWTRPPEVAEVDARTGDVRNTGLLAPAAGDYGDIDEVRLYAPATDGARIPITLLYRRSTRLTGDNPTLLSVLGAWGDPSSPVFDAARLAWLERGGVFAVAHVRGGGEYGDRWHASGRGATKGTTVSDFITACEFLQRYGFTNNNRLAIEGTEAGGIPVGDALVERPDLFAVAVLRDPILDLPALEASAAGRAKLAEFGSPADVRGRERLDAISPYQRLRDGMPYPAVLIAVDDSQPDDVSQATRMAQRLQHASTSGKPVLLRLAPDGATRAAREAQLADIYAFALWQLGDSRFEPAPPRPPQPPPGTRALPAS